MKSNELRIKLAAAQTKVEKIEKTISRYEERISKKKAEIRSHGWDEMDPWCKADTPEHNEAYWMICDYSHLVEDHKNALKKLKEAQRITEAWRDKFNAQKKQEDLIATEMPEIFRRCQEDLANSWTQHDISVRDAMLTKKEELDHESFRKIYSYKKEQSLMYTDEEVRSSNMRTAEVFIIDLYNRVKAITGEVKSWKDISYGGKALNGVVIGEEGSARVETILAGGYNIQRLHYRVLVNRI